MKCFKIVLVTALICYQVNCTGVIKMKQEADTAKQQSDSILKEFKTIDENLERSKQAIDSSGKVLRDALEKKNK
jgi:hypothetical protein